MPTSCSGLTDLAKADRVLRHSAGHARPRSHRRSTERVAGHRQPLSDHCALLSRRRCWDHDQGLAGRVLRRNGRPVCTAGLRSECRCGPQQLAACKAQVRFHGSRLNHERSPRSDDRLGDLWSSVFSGYTALPQGLRAPLSRALRGARRACLDRSVRMRDGCRCRPVALGRHLAKLLAHAWSWNGNFGRECLNVPRAEGLARGRSSRQGTFPNTGPGDAQRRLA